MVCDTTLGIEIDLRIEISGQTDSFFEQLFRSPFSDTLLEATVRPLRLTVASNSLYTGPGGIPSNTRDQYTLSVNDDGPGGYPINTPGPPSFTNNSFYRSQPSGQAFVQNNTYIVFGDDSSNHEVMDPRDVDLTEGGIPDLPCKFSPLLFPTVYAN